MHIRSSLFIGFALLALNGAASASSELAQTFTLDGRLYADAAGMTPLTDADVTVVIQIVDQSQNCVLYEETRSHFNAAIGNGYFTFQVGSVIGAAKRSSLDSAHSMAEVYSNSSAAISGRTFGGAACSYSPSPNDQRYVRMLVTPSSDGVTRTLSPNMALDSVPMATVAERAESLQGLSASQVLQVNTSGSEVLSQSNLENVFSSSNYSALTSLLSGSSSMYSKAASNGTSVLPNVSSPSTPAAGQMWYDGGAIKYYDGSSTQTLGTAGSGITSLTIGTGLTPTGTISSSGSVAVDVGTTAGKIVQVDTGDKLPAIDGSALTNLNGSAVNSGTIGGTTAVNTSGNITTTGTLSSGAITSSGNITTSGDISGNNITASGNATVSGNANVTGNVVASGNGSFAAVSSGQISLFDSATTNTNYVTLKTPATGTLTSDYTLTLPPTLPGVPGQVLTSDTSGVLSWSSPSTGSVTSVTSSGAPIVIGGSASALTVGVNAATTAASGVVQLAASGGTTAGTVVQANDTRLSDSRAPSGGASGDLAGTYPNPTVAGIQGKAITYTTLTTGDHLKYDGSGWVNAVLSAADLSDSSDLLKASNMPATCAADKTLTFSSPTGTWVCSSIAIDAAAITSGTIDAARLPAEAKYWESATGGINYAGGNVGIGVTSPLLPLHIYGGTLMESGGVDSEQTNLVIAAYGFPTSYVHSVSSSHSAGTPANNNLKFNLSNTSGTTSTIMTLVGTGNVGIGTTTPSEKLEVAGKIKGTELCIGTDCRSGWPGSGGGGTVTSVASGTGLTGGPITSTGTLAVDVGTTAGKIVQVDTGDKLPVIDGSQLTNLNASNLASGTVAAARMPALTGDVTTSAGGVATTLAKIQGKTLTVTSPASGDLLKYDGSGWVNSALSSADLSDASSLIKSTQMPASCGADHTLTFSSPTGTWACTSIAIDAAAITSGTIDAARLPAEAKYWESATGGINYAGGNVGIGTTAPGSKLTVAGNVALTSAGSKITTAATEMVLEQTGDTYGPIRLHLQNRNGSNGAIFENANIDLVDFGFLPSSGAQNNIRMEHRSAQLKNSGNTGGEFQLIDPLANAQGDVWLATGKSATIFNMGNVGIGTTSPTEKLDVNGKIKGTELCIGSDCRSAWPGSGGGGTVTSVAAGTGLTGGPITSTGTLAVDVGTTAGKIVQVDTGDKLPAIDGSQLTNLNASSLASGTVPDARMPALTGDVTTSAGSVATTLAKIQGKSLTVSSPVTGDMLKYDGSGWVNAALSTANLSDASDLLKASNMPGTCSADKTLTFSSPTGTWVCSSIAIDAAAITSGTIADARLPASAKYWQSATGGINYASGNVGIGAAAPGEKLEVAGNIKLTGTGNGITFPDGTTQTTASGGASQWTTTGSDIYYNTGKVGVGTTAPGVDLDVNGVLRVGTASIHDASHAALSFKGNGSYGLVEMNGARGAGGALSSGTTYWNSTTKIAEVDAYTGTGVTSGALTFSTANSGTLAEAMRIDQTGSVGIGTASPSYPLTVNKAAGSYAGVFGDSTGAIGVGAYTGGVPMIQGGSDLTMASAKPVALQPFSGNVGIGTTAPAAKLEVAGGAVIGTGVGARTMGVVSFFTPTTVAGAYIHIKTPFRPAVDSRMYLFKVTGFSYGDQKDVDLTYTGYAYVGSPTIVSAPQSRDPQGFYSPTQYVGSDGYIYLRFKPGSTYYLSFTVDSIFVGNGRIVYPGEMTVTLSTTATL